MKIIILSLASIVFASCHAFADNTQTIEKHGTLKSGNGPCIIKVVKASPETMNDFYEVSITTERYRFNFVNQLLENGYFNKASEIFEKESDGYHMIIATLSPLPRFHRVTLENLGDNTFKIKRTLYLFGYPTFTHSDECVIQ